MSRKRKIAVGDPRNGQGNLFGPWKLVYLDGVVRTSGVELHIDCMQPAALRGMIYNGEIEHGAALIVLPLRFLELFRYEENIRVEHILEPGWGWPGRRNKIMDEVRCWWCEQPPPTTIKQLEDAIVIANQRS